MSSVFATQRALLKSNIDCDLATLDRGDISMVRNIFASAAIQAGGFTHLLFSDHDMDYSPRDVLKLVAAQKPVIGCIYRRRKETVEWAVKSDGEIRPDENGLAKVDGIGAGLMLIQMTVFRDLMATNKLRRVPRAMHQLPARSIYGFFDQIPIGEDFLPEDYSFCERWRVLCGGEVWADASANIGHIGDATYRGSYLDNLKGRTQSP